MRSAREFSAICRCFGLVLGLGAAACGPGKNKPTAAPDAKSQSVQAPAGDIAETGDEPASAPPDESAHVELDPEAVKTPSPVELCLAMCDRVASLCTKNAADACRTNCAQYEHPPEGCDLEVRAALECASKAKDLTCVIIAPESCAPEFRRLVACSTGKEAPGAREVAEARLPDGWERFEAASQGFAVTMPRGVSEKTDAKEPTYAVDQGQAAYSVRVLPPPKAKPTQKNLVPLATGLLGKCARKLKLYGLIERPDRVSIRYDSRCADGAEWRGSLVITATRMYVLRVTAPAGVQVDADAFVYGFELL